MTLLHVTATAKCNDRESLIEAIKKLATVDKDLNGSNINGYPSDMDATIAHVKGIKSDEKAVKKFADLWFKENSYYSKYDLSIKKADNILFVSLTTLSAD